MSSFFTLPASQKKRKRVQLPDKSNGTIKRPRKDDNDSISGSDISDNDAPARADDLSRSEDEDEESENEDPAAKRIRLAEQYLANTQKEIQDQVGFDAAEVDQENLQRRMGERLKEDTAETKGKLYRWIADGLDWRRAETRALRCHGVNKSWAGVDVHGQHLYAAAADLSIVKWEMPDADQDTTNRRERRNPKVVARSRGNRKDKRAQHHEKAILCLAVSPDGKYVATGGLDRKLIIWDALLKPLKVFTHHRDAVTALAFRRGTNQLFSASKDRTVKIWSLDELAYVETLFGHQDSVIDVGALTQEKCITVGSRDRTARLWKVVEESQLVFRGGGAPHKPKRLDALKAAYEDDSAIGMDDESSDPSQYHEGSIDRLALIDDDTFITASDNGSLSLWNVHKKKAVFVYPLAHGLDPALPLAEASADIEPDEGSLTEKSRGGRQPRWITAMKSIPFSDVFVTGSWDGYVRAWKVGAEKRRIEPLGAVGRFPPQSVDDLLALEGLSSDSLSQSALAALKAGVDSQQSPPARSSGDEIRGIINDIVIVDRGARGKDGVLIAAAVGREHRLGRWRQVEDGRNQVVMLSVPKKGIVEDDDREQLNGGGEGKEGEEGFAGFD